MGDLANGVLDSGISVVLPEIYLGVECSVSCGSADRPGFTKATFVHFHCMISSSQNKVDLKWPIRKHSRNTLWLTVEEEDKKRKGENRCSLHGFRPVGRYGGRQGQGAMI